MNTKLYGPQTEAALSNFPFEYHTVQREFIYAIVQIKKAAAIANAEAKVISGEQAKAIRTACDAILDGKHDDQFVVSAHHGGAGTSVNMNVNEVIAKLSGTHPNDHVNASQSTNDVNPSALRIAVIYLSIPLLKAIDHLIHTLDAKSVEYGDVVKLGRTHMQDAVPTTLAAEFTSYRDTVTRGKNRIEHALSYLYELNMGGTAIGNSINASSEYINAIYPELRGITGIGSLKPMKNCMSGTSSDTDFCNIASSINLLCVDLSKIAHDLRFMASGPKGGIGEISFGKLQPGSSIMPGKVNPIIAETMNQTYYLVHGRTTSMYQAAEAAHLELGVMLPIIADSLITIIKTVTTAVRLFADKGFGSIEVHKDTCREHLENSTAYAALLVPVLGYDKASQLVQEAVQSGKTLRQVVLQSGTMTEKEFEKIIA